MTSPRVTVAIRRGVTHDYVTLPLDPPEVVPTFASDDRPATVADALGSAGCAVVRGVVSPASCDRLVRAFREEVKPSDELFPRHQGGRATRHELDEFGHMKWGMTNVHLLPTTRYGGFVGAVLDVVTDPGLTALVRGLFGEPGKIVNTMFFEGNQYTHAHQDSWYKDSQRIGELVAAWIALEDIAEEAGRFFVGVGSRTLDLMPVRAQQLPTSADVQRFLDERQVRCAAPALQKGDLVLWTSLTLHGSLETTDGTRSRTSLTSHFLPASHELLYLRQPVRPRYAASRGVELCQCHDEELMAQLKASAARANVHHGGG